LPRLSLIPRSAKNAYMISIAFKGISGEDDFKFMGEEKTITPGEDRRIRPAKK
jgi:hypothetical protein